MTFYERYAELCKEKGLNPCGPKTETLIGVNRTTVNKWNMNGTTPKGETICLIADYFQVSTDYLLGRTENREGISNGDTVSANGKNLLALFDQLSTSDQQDILDYCAFKVHKSLEEKK